MGAPAPTDPTRPLRLAVYAILIALSTGHMCGRILAINSVDKIGLETFRVQDEVKKREAAAKEAGEPFDKEQATAEARKAKSEQRPFLSANDRSRWNTVRSLVEKGTYQIDEIQAERGWDTIDMVQHVGWDGEKHLYSSKPPLFATLMAGPYWLIVKTTGATLGTHPYEIGRGLVILFNLVPMVLYFVLLAVLAERWGTTDWGKLIMMATATFATFLSLFVVSINNHTHAAVCTTIVFVLAGSIWYDGRREAWRFALAGFFAAMLVACELPALSLFAAISAALLWKAPKQTLIAYLPLAAIVFAANMGTNYLSHGTIKPAYAHRSETNPEQNWYRFKYVRDGKERDSYWSNPQGVDAGEKSPGMYAVHALVGHHGIFSLTPMWILSFIGLGMALADPNRRGWGLVFAAVSIVCVLFFLFPIKDIDRNYGGMTSGFRWVFWMAPLWLVALLPTADWLGRTRWGRGLTLVLLALSTLSVAYPWQPWKQPWIAEYMLHMGWIKF